MSPGYAGMSLAQNLFVFAGSSQASTAGMKIVVIRRKQEGSVLDKRLSDLPKWWVITLLIVGIMWGIAPGIRADDCCRHRGTGRDRVHIQNTAPRPTAPKRSKEVLAETVPFGPSKHLHHGKNDNWMYALDKNGQMKRVEFDATGILRSDHTEDVARELSASYSDRDNTNALVRAIRKRYPPPHLEPFFDHRYKTVMTEKERRLSLVDSCFWGKKPTLVVVGRGVKDKERTTEFLKEFLKSYGASKVTEGLIQDPLGNVKIAWKQANNTLSKKEKMKSLAGLQLILMTDSRIIWPQAYEEGWQAARAIAEREYPGYNRGLSRLFGGEEKFLRRATPLVNKKVPAEAANRYFKEMEQAVNALSENLSEDQVKISALLEPQAAQSMMASLQIEGPQFRVLLIDTDGKVIQSWKEGEIDPLSISQEYRKLSAEHAEGEKQSGLAQSNKVWCP